MKHYFIINEAAGDGSAKNKFVPSIEKIMNKHGLEYEIYNTIDARQTSEYVSQLVEKGDEVRFYAVGGDGTASDVLQGLVGHSNAQLAVVPFGSGNDFVRNFTNKENCRDLEKYINGYTRPVDVLKYNDTYSLNMINIGIDCDIVAEASAIKSSIIKGSMTYIAGIIKVLPKHKYYRMRYRLDGVEHEEELMLAAFGNGRFCGGGFKSCPEAAIDDGIMDICLVKPVRGLKMLKILLEYKNGTYLQDKMADSFITYIRCQEFWLKPCEPVRVCVDGEVSYFDESTVSVVRNAINLVIPEGCEFI